MRTIDDIIPPSRRRETGKIIDKSNNRENRNASSKYSLRFPYKILTAVAIVIIVSFGVLYYFANAEVNITPNTVSATIQSPFIATQSSGILPYEIITAQKIASQAVKGNGTKTVNTKASGYITIYNTQSKAQRLVTNTRFATTAGFIFRIHKRVTIPAGNTSKPGSLRALVYADKTGGVYNVAATSFTIPGFAGMPQASSVYARSSKSMVGGASGTVPVISSPIEIKARKALADALAPDLATSLKSQIPSGYILIPGAATTTYKELIPTKFATTGMVNVREQGTMTAIVFPNKDIAKAIANSISGLNYQGNPVTLTTSKDIQLTTVALPEPNAPSFSFTLTGTASLVYTIDSTQIAATVAGKTRSEAEVALTNYQEIKRAIIILRPFWRQTFPADPASINITENNP